MFPDHAKRLGVTTFPGLVVSDLPEQRHFPMTGAATHAGVLAHCKAFMGGEAAPHMRSQAAPEVVWAPGEVRQLVRSTFEAEMMEDGVSLVFFDAPWCKEGKRLRDNFGSVATAFAEHSNVKIGTFDVSENDAPFLVPAPLPTVMLFKGGKKVVYHGEHTLSAIKFFVESELL
jgi:thioredoxin-like negative regulator of GroEL